MKTAARRTAAFLALVLLLPGLLLGAALSLPRVYQDSYYAELAEMTARLDAARGRRLIVIGGSSVAFGLDVPLLEAYLRGKGFGVTVCPMGLYAAVGASAMLSLTEGALREGDTVVLTFEPTSETMSTYFGATAFLKCAESDPALLLRLNGDQRARAIGNALSCLQEKYAAVQSGQLPRAEGVYAKAAFSEECSMTYPREGNLLPLGYDTASPITLSAVSIEDAFATQVNAFCKKAAAKGAEVLMSFCPMNKSAIPGDLDEEAQAFFSLCNAAFHCPIISSPLDYVMDSGWFYDSNFHLNTAGAQVRTWKLAQDLLAQWGCYAALEAELPAMPASIAAPAAEAVETDHFLFEEMENGLAYTVSGLTDSGAAKETLALPSSHLGKPVAAIEADALAQAVRLEELRVPESIAALPDGLLDACVSLRRLVLTHQSAPCRISAHSLDNLSSLQILVPAETYTWYRDGYGCEENPWHRYLSQIFTY